MIKFSKRRSTVALLAATAATCSLVMLPGAAWAKAECHNTDYNTGQVCIEITGHGLWVDRIWGSATHSTLVHHVEIAGPSGDDLGKHLADGGNVLPQEWSDAYWYPTGNGGANVAPGEYCAKLWSQADDGRWIHEEPAKCVNVTN